MLINGFSGNIFNRKEWIELYAEESREFIGNGVVAVDLCGAEDIGFCNKFVNSMAKAREYGYHITIHAGETGSGQNVIDAIEIFQTELEQFKKEIKSDEWDKVSEKMHKANKLEEIFS